MKQVKITKRQAKAMRGFNAAQKRSLNEGDVYEIAGVEYKGLPRLFSETGRVIRQGVPFVRVKLKPRYIHSV